jgi:hypothetical protein
LRNSGAKGKTSTLTAVFGTRPFTLSYPASS